MHGEGEEGRARGGEGGEAVRGEADPKPGAACQDTRYSERRLQGKLISGICKRKFQFSVGGIENIEMMHLTFSFLKINISRLWKRLQKVFSLFFVY